MDKIAKEKKAHRKWFTERYLKYRKDMHMHGITPCSGVRVVKTS